MGATNSTPTVALSQFVGTDKPTWLGDYNSDMGKIDTRFGAVATELGTTMTAATNATTAATNATSAAQDAVATAATVTAGLSTVNGEIDDIDTALAARYTKTEADALLVASRIQGLYSARPAANTVPAGTKFYCTNIPEQYISNGTTWRVVGSGGNEYGRTQLTATGSPVGPAATDIAGLTVTFVAGERPLDVSFFGVFQASTAGPDIKACQVQLDNVDIGSGHFYPGAAGLPFDMFFTAGIPAQTPGTTHTVKVKVSAGTGTVNVLASAGSPTYLSVKSK